MTDAIVASNLVVAMGRQTILGPVSLELPSGRTAALLGGPGAGKSAFIHTLIGRAKRSGGDLLVCGTDPSVNPAAVRRCVTYVGNPDVLEPHLTARQNVLHLLALAGTTVADRTDVARALRDVDVPDRAIDVAAGRLTKLIMLSIWLAVSRLRSSSLILLDDPTAFLDASEASHLCSLLQEAAVAGRAVLVTTRDARFAEEAASAVYLMVSGHLSRASRSRLQPVPI